MQLGLHFLSCIYGFKTRPHNLVLVSERGRRVAKDVASATVHASSDRMEGAGVIWTNIYSGTDFRALQRVGSRGYLRGDGSRIF